uniref:Protein kinase domain-containing protein n=1 Tax=Amphimedon queenslandica TaxID=400682 RepID=A0A1X7UFI4_AMPQE
MEPNNDIEGQKKNKPFIIPETANERHAITIGDITYFRSEKLGVGAKENAVYKGQFKGQDIAVKKVGKKDVIEDITEIKLLMKCRNQNIVEYYHFESDIEYHYLAFQLCLTSLEKFIIDKKQREVILQGFIVNKRDIISDAIRGLNHLHEKHIVHRDIKPSNILLVQRHSFTKEIKAVIADFGTATEIDFDEYLKTISRVRGTLVWLAPELLGDKKPKFSKAIDIFSMGCVIYYVLSDGHHPLGDESLDIGIALKSYSTHSFTLDGISDEVEDKEPAKDLIMQMMHENKDLRIPIGKVLDHCYFWSKEKQLKFLEAASDIIESTDDHTIEHGASDVIGTNWMDRIDTAGIPGKYDPILVKDLLRAIKAKKHSLSVSSINRHFPMLLIHVYKQMKSHDKTLLCYYQSDAGDTRNLQNLIKEKERQIVTLNELLKKTEQELEAEVEKYQEVQQYRDQLNEKYREIAEKDQEIKSYSHQLQEKEAQREQENQEYQELFETMDRKLQEKDRELMEKDMELQKKDRELQEKDRELRQSQEAVRRYQQQALTDDHWVINKDEVTLTKEELGRGSYAVVTVGIFRGLRVAVKSLHTIIISNYNLALFSREMSISSQVRHPKLVQFIGATKVGNPLILTELMSTSLNHELQRNRLSNQQILSIAQDVALGLNYLHLFKPQPIIHRDVSSPNILLKPCSGAAGYEAKVADYGTAKVVQANSTGTVMPGNVAYAAPEAPIPDQHSPAMDVYSHSVLLMEMNLHCQPEMRISERTQQSGRVSWSDMKSLIQRGLDADPRARPTMAQVIEALKRMKI